MYDPASHAYGGERVRNAPIYQEPGTIYVYFIYGMHYCMNIVTGAKGHGQAVLIRALQPTDGLELMRSRRGVVSDTQLTSGPAKLAQALAVTPALNGTHVRHGQLWLEPGITPREITQTTRVGISKAVDHPWRFYTTDNQFVSKR
jgi:DNA-3-methyladenine glycosylase